MEHKEFYCCVVTNGQPKCEQQCQFCIDWVNEADELSKNNN